MYKTTELQGNLNYAKKEGDKGKNEKLFIKYQK